MQPSDSLTKPPAESVDPDPAGDADSTLLLSPDAEGRVRGTHGSRRRPGRPLEMSADDMLELIRQLAQRKEGLFRVHLTAPGLYARARRLFGSWSAAVRRAGIDYDWLQGLARARSVQTRRRNRRRTPLNESRAPSGVSHR